MSEVVRPEPIAYAIRQTSEGGGIAGFFKTASGARGAALKGPYDVVALYDHEAFEVYERALTASQAAENALRNEVIGYRNDEAVAKGATIAKAHAAGCPAPAESPDQPRETTADAEYQR